MTLIPFYSWSQNYPSNQNAKCKLFAVRYLVETFPKQAIYLIFKNAKRQLLILSIAWQSKLGFGLVILNDFILNVLCFYIFLNFIFIKSKFMKQIDSQPEELKYVATDAQGQCVLVKISPVRFNLIKFVVFVIASVIFAFIPLLLILWYPVLKRIFYYDYAPLQESTHVAIINYDEQTTICELQKDVVSLDELKAEPILSFVNRYMKYTITLDKVVKALLFNEKQRLYRITKGDNERGLNESQVQGMRKSFGRGTMEIQKPTWYVIAGKQLIRPLYLFLFFSVGLWIYQAYYIYAGIIFGFCVLGIIVTVWSTYKNNEKIFQMAFHQVKLNVLREGNVKEISSLQVVPGDIVFLKDPIKIPFEGIILEGSALINECALTGESVPIVKKADVRDHYTSLKSTIDKAAYVYEGTTIIQVNSKKKMAQFESTREAYGIPVCVTRTNFVTMKGQLIRIILFPKEQENIFQRESAKFIFCLFFIAMITYFGMISHLQEGAESLDIFVKFLDLIAITVPPALPVSMAFGVVYAVEKLNEKKIFCIDDNKIITGGAVSFSCFDKTGTLTEDFMDFEALIPADKGNFYEKMANKAQNKVYIPDAIKAKPYLQDIYNNMASNHSIIRIEATGEMIGDPMEIKLFEFGEFTLNQSLADPEVIFAYESTRGQRGEIFRRFEFDSDLQRMSVVAKVATKEGAALIAYAKGSPEMMATIMEKSSIPFNYNEVLKEYTSNGFRVLAIGSKRVQGNDHKSITREMAETGLIFNGFQVFENKLKPETKGAIRELKEAKIGVVMITGDNALTGSNIGYKCGISHKDQGMIICDYKDGKFTEENFVYNKNDNQNNDQLQKGQEQGGAPSSNIITRKPLEIEIFTNQKVTNDFGHKLSANPSSEQFMTYIIQKAKLSNCQLCVTGNAFNKLFEGKVEEISDLKKQFLDCSTVYARTKPNDKAKIVMVYQHTGKTVSMCGDGANDCGALKQADIGLSLSQAEASISAPFTSQVTNITSMVELLKECRAGLATNFSLFNIMASYSLIQYTTTTISEIYYGYPSQYEYMFWDIGCNFFFILFVGMTATVSKLSIERPSSSLFCFSNLFQVLFAFALNIIGQICMIQAISGAFSDYVNYPSTGGMDNARARIIATKTFSSDIPQISVIFLFSNFMYIFTVVAFSIGEPWKKPFYTNLCFMISLTIILTYSILVCAAPVTRLAVFSIVQMDDMRVNGFVLGMGFLFGLGLWALQIFVWVPLTQYFKAKYPQKAWI